MSRLYQDQHRALQDRFQSRPMADRIEQIALKTEIGPDEQAFIESRDFFFLTTVDGQGRPTVSYKGGAPGFMRVLDPTHVIFPSYDGNGMYLSMGNITATPRSASCSSTSSGLSGCACRARRRCRPRPSTLPASRRPSSSYE
jgi:uncharacterized protein